MKLGKRLQKIKEMAVFASAKNKRDFDEIWDCCCDHGYLGFALLLDEGTSTINFVDVVPLLTDAIEEKLKHFFVGDSNKWKVHCIDVAQLPLNLDEQKKHLIIIAGVGGELIIAFLQAIFSKIKNNQQIHVEFILSPVHHNLALRSFLMKYDYLMINEKLVFENNRAYEVLHIALLGTRKVSLTGDLMWNFEDPEHLQYIKKKMQHYQRKGEQQAYQAYQKLLENFKNI